MITKAEPKILLLSTLTDMLWQNGVVKIRPEDIKNGMMIVNDCDAEVLNPDDLED